jgi:hypothetical protein
MVFTQDRWVAPSPQRQTGAPGSEAREGRDHGRLPGGGGRPVAVSQDGRTVYTAGACDDGKFTDDDSATIAYRG